MQSQSPKLSRRVEVLSPTGEVLYYARRGQAKWMIAAGAATRNESSGPMASITANPDYREDRATRQQKIGSDWRQLVVRNAAASVVAAGIQHQRLLRDAVGSHTGEEWEQVLRRADWRCFRCGVSDSDDKLTKDHIVPLAMGGTNYASNLQPLCRSCNSWKGNREIDFRPMAHPSTTECRMPKVVAGSDAPVEVEVAATA